MKPRRNLVPFCPVILLHKVNIRSLLAEVIPLASHKSLTYTVVSFEQFLNIELVEGVQSSVAPLKSSVTKFVQLMNIEPIVVTFEVLKPLKSSVVSEEQPEKR